ncbi:MAG: 1-deoxy-D-xylulose-5-phosphate synthase, partial [Clostridia bacterium]|nr:1-deoxy-D-xylulose-5-phosphate synthase [Clostridia bacterium]
MEYNVLSDIFNGKSLKDISNENIPLLCKDIRDFLMENVSKTGGHLASNLGVVELTVALHRVFDSPKDKIVFDVGHQSYVHKILTGRAKEFSKLRKKDGLSGFPRPDESVHDAFLAGHSSTSVSAALGIATANKLKSDDSFTIAVIGDGAMTGGLAFEGINNAGRSKTKLLIVINDNGQSISKNVGAFSKYLSTYTSTRRYFDFKDTITKRLKSIPVIGNALYKAVKKTKNGFKKLLTKGHVNYFENLGFRYFGPIDGHDENKIEMVFERVKELETPCVVHLKTQKGHGYDKAEHNPTLYHGVSNFDADFGVAPNTTETFSSHFGKFLTECAKNDSAICAITAAMCDGVGLDCFEKQFPDRFFDVGIAESHAVTFAAGLAINGCKPVFACYSSFLQRSFDQILHDVALQKLPVILAVDRAGFVGDDGETHQGLFDVSMLLEIPGVTIYSPVTYKQQEYAVSEGLKAGGLTCVRYPKGSQNEDYAELLSFTEDYKAFDCEDADIITISYGRQLLNLFEAKKQTDKKIGS